MIPMGQYVENHSTVTDLETEVFAGGPGAREIMNDE
jgi:hypothetical protein